MDFSEAELIYKTGLVYTASSSRLILLLYNKLSLELKATLAHYRLEPVKAMTHLNLAFKVLSELLKTFLASEDPAYKTLYLTHEPMATRISKIFAQNKIEAQDLSELIALASEYQAAWKKALKIKERKAQHLPPLNVRPKPN